MWELYTLACPTIRGSRMPNELKRASIEPTLICLHDLCLMAQDANVNTYHAGIYPHYVHALVEICEISDSQEQSVKVNALNYVVALME